MGQHTTTMERNLSFPLFLLFTFYNKEKKEKKERKMEEKALTEATMSKHQDGEA
jgi:hypothetical protein